MGSLVAARQLLSCGTRTLSCSMHVGSSSLTKDRTLAPCIGSAESYPLRHQGSPNNPFLKSDQDDVVQSCSWHIVGAQKALVSSLLHGSSVNSGQKWWRLHSSSFCIRYHLKTHGLERISVYYRSWDDGSVESFFSSWLELLMCSWSWMGSVDSSADPGSALAHVWGSASCQLV